MTPTAKERIIEYMTRYPKPIAVHEFNLMGVSQNGIASRLAELAAEGKVTGRFRITADGKKKPFKEWLLIKDGQQELTI